MASPCIANLVPLMVTNSKLVMTSPNLRDDQFMGNLLETRRN